MLIITPKVRLTEHFKYTESNIACPCCGELQLSDLFFRHMKRLELLRIKAGFPITVNSGHRCEKHNRKVGGAKKSMHLLFATDIRASDGDLEKLKILLELVIEYGFNGIGLYWSFIHIDLRQRPYYWDNQKSNAVKR